MIHLLPWIKNEKLDYSSLCMNPNAIDCLLISEI